MPQKAFELYEEDFTKAIMDYLMFKDSIDIKIFNDALVKKVLYESDIDRANGSVVISINATEKIDEEN